jgi:hypothetical protein
MDSRLTSFHAAGSQVQKSWMYLEPIFSAQDIQKQLPSEYRAFDHVHKQLREIMRRTKDRPNALQTASNPSEDLARTICFLAYALSCSSR